MKFGCRNSWWPEDEPHWWSQWACSAISRSWYSPILRNISLSIRCPATDVNAQIFLPIMRPKDFGDSWLFLYCHKAAWYLWFWRKCLNNYRMDCHENWDWHSCPTQARLWLKTASLAAFVEMPYSITHNRFLVDHLYVNDSSIYNY